eukprot:TRINITY_DN4796_c0_g2_i1.p1 TRINITY_DN4796_c0_g2~~TRINITY_DN4796_c0_g2_i1.p1  ORF type:complete len:567 (-),score=95.57 TRINITY_DN4796_c0_g2_i1:220-1920(-)
MPNRHMSRAGNNDMTTTKISTGTGSIGQPASICAARTTKIFIQRVKTKAGGSESSGRRMKCFLCAMSIPGQRCPKTHVLLLKDLESNPVIEDSGIWAASNSVPHGDNLVGLLKLLEINEVVVTSAIPKDVAELSDEAEGILQHGSAEVRTYKAVPLEGITKNELEAFLGAQVVRIGFNHAMRAGWISYDKLTDRISRRLTTEPADATRDSLLRLHTHGLSALPAATIDMLKKRQLVSIVKRTTFRVERGRRYAPNWTEPPRPLTELTPEILRSGTWQEAHFKDRNLNGPGVVPHGGYLHPVLKVRGEVREAFLEMGFEEMPTGNYVESSFWNFDAPFYPQRHSARDDPGILYLSEPAATSRLPDSDDYLQRVRHAHARDGDGWDETERRRNLLRTHLSAVSFRTLYQLAQDGFQPKKYFSIDRVFRDEEWFLPEFHEIQGLVVDHDLSQANLVGVVAQFFQRLGFDKLRFRPAYSPSAEPSMTVLFFSERINKWIEIGNAGVFRPEVLSTVGLPEGVRAIAWSLSLERLTMIEFRICSTRDLVGQRQRLDLIKNTPICRLDKQARR